MQECSSNTLSAAPANTKHRRLLPRGAFLSKLIKSDAVLECYERAAEARHIAETVADPITKADFLEIERHWHFLARRFLPRPPPMNNQKIERWQ